MQSRCGKCGKVAFLSSAEARRAATDLHRRNNHKLAEKDAEADRWRRAYWATKRELDPAFFKRSNEEG